MIAHLPWRDRWAVLSPGDRKQERLHEDKGLLPIICVLSQKSQKK